MWTVLTKDGHMVSENDGMWPDLPKDIVIQELRYRGQHGGVYSMVGCRSYGFQRFRVEVPDKIVSEGVQLIGIKDGRAMTLEIDETNETRRRWTVPESELTYSRELLRHGEG